MPSFTAPLALAEYDYLKINLKICHIKVIPYSILGRYALNVFHLEIHFLEILQQMLQGL